MSQLRKDHRIFLKIVEAKNISRKDEEVDAYCFVRILQDPTEFMTPGASERRASVSGIPSKDNLSVSSGKSTMGRRKSSASPHTVMFHGKTKTSYKSKTPWFDDDFEYELSDNFSDVVVELFVKGVIKDKLVGQITLPRLSLELDNRSHEDWYSLRDIQSTEDSTEEKRATKAHDFQAYKQTTPQTCMQCNQIVWGLNQCMRCTACNAASHAKCVAAFPQTCGIHGAIRIKYTYVEEYILPLPSYAKLLELMLDNEYRVIYLLGRVTDDRDELSKTLNMITENAGLAVEYINCIAEMEIQVTLTAATIFRANSLASKSIDNYMKLTGMKYLRNVLQPLIKEIWAQSRPCELDPSRLGPGDNREENLTVLEAYIRWCIDRILSSTSTFPTPLRRIFANLRRVATSTFPNDPVVSYTVITAFLFLRFFNAAILGPQLFGITDDGEPPSAKNARTLTLISKTVQQLANMTPFDGKKEPFMEVLNPIINDNIGRLKRFIDEIALPVSDSEIASFKKKQTMKGQKKGLGKIFSFLKTDKDGEKDMAVDVERHLAVVHRHLIKNTDKMQAAATEEEKVLMVDLIQILNDMMETYNKKSNEIQAIREENLRRLALDSGMDVTRFEPSSTVDRGLPKRNSTLSTSMYGDEAAQRRAEKTRSIPEGPETQNHESSDKTTPAK